MLTSADLARRRGLITASDIAPILGLHPHRSALAVYLEKRGQAPPFSGNEDTKWGNLLEPLIRADFAERHGLAVREVGIQVHPVHARHGASPDGIVDAAHAGLEIKRVRSHHVAAEYGRANTDEVPIYVATQCQWSMHVTGLDRWYVSAMIYGAPRDFLVERDEVMIDAIIPAADRFLADVDAGRLPNPDGSKDADRALAALYPSHKTPLATPTEDERALILELRRCSADAKRAETAKKIAAQAIKLALGAREGFIAGTNARGEPEALTWKQPKDSTETDWKALAGDLRNRIQLEISVGDHGVQDGCERIEKLVGAGFAELIADHTMRLPNARRLNPPYSWRKDAPSKDDDDAE